MSPHEFARPGLKFELSSLIQYCKNKCHVYSSKLGHAIHIVIIITPIIGTFLA